MNKIFTKVFLTEDDVLQPIKNTIHEAILERQKTLDNAAFDVFAEYGYSREWILDPANRDRICITELGNRGIFMVDNRHLFSITPISELKDDYYLHTICEVKYIAPLPEEETNET